MTGLGLGDGALVVQKRAGGDLGDERRHRRASQRRRRRLRDVDGADDSGDVRACCDTALCGDGDARSIGSASWTSERQGGMRLGSDAGASST